MATTYTVKKGDTLWGIATTYASTISGSNTSAKVQTLVKLNDITDPDYIVVGQVLQLDGSEPSPATNNTSKAKIKVFGHFIIKYINTTDRNACIIIWF